MKPSNHPARTKRQQLISLIAVLAVLGVAAFAFFPAQSAGVASKATGGAARPAASSSAPDEGEAH
ncbi:MAG: hypothetical protein H7Z38_12170, partial [Rubrivivax sp.]|nr:hypothetical protein [Pyrinomonadaceae bacterium]